MNRLHSALSPYLLLHADQPVHWQQWDDAAFAQARREDKVILLSIGYAACHWCHVMAHESFADAETAEIMNAHFINIKVDREERPDIDRIYQAAHSVFTRRSGGWPLTMFLTPAGEPFFGGTYFPPQARHGLPGFPHLLQRVATAWQERRADITAQNHSVLQALRTLDTHAPSDNLGSAPLHAAAEQFCTLFDAEHGGLGEAPKFPHPVELTFCLRIAREHNHAALLQAVYDTLLKMARGGLCDHLGGGFFRYCVDARWQVPHFEKMLYDNGLLLSLYAEAAAHWQEDAALQQVVAHTAEWALREMRHTDGSFYAALDADSGGGEGGFYLWEEAELQAALSAPEYAVLASHYGIAAAARVEGKVHLARRQTLAQTARACALDETTCAARLAAAQDKLYAQRAQRPRPRTDDKILTAWNGLLILGLARAARLGDNADWHAAARQAFDAVWQNLRADGRTRTARRQGQISAHGFLDDCAFLLAAAVELLRAEVCPQVLTAACALAEELCTHYQDEEAGGFFFTAGDGETLIRRIKTGEDGAIPGGNGVAAQALLLLAQLAGKPQWQQAATRTLHAFYATVCAHPTAHASLLSALHTHLHPPPLLLLSGCASTCRHWRNALRAEAAAACEVFCLPPDTSALPPPLQKPTPPQGALAYVCDVHGCSPPLSSLAQVQQLLAK